MSIKILYHLLFCKVYKITSLTREQDEASFLAGVSVGILFVLFITYTLDVLFVKYVPLFIGMMLGIFSVVINVIYFFGKKRYIKVISETKSRKLPFFYHFIVYIFIFWGLCGFLFL
jgi:hypothetical protein